MSESGHFTSKEVLKDRKLRKLEALTYVSMDSLLTWKRVAGWLSKKHNAFNEGNSVRQIGIYLTEFAYAGLGEYDGDYFKVSMAGTNYVQEELNRAKGWFKPFEFMKEEFAKWKESLSKK